MPALVTPDPDPAPKSAAYLPSLPVRMALLRPCPALVTPVRPPAPPLVTPPPPALIPDMPRSLDPPPPPPPRPELALLLLLRFGPDRDVPATLPPPGDERSLCSRPTLPAPLITARADAVRLTGGLLPPPAGLTRPAPPDPATGAPRDGEGDDCLTPWLEVDPRRRAMSPVPSLGSASAAPPPRISWAPGGCRIWCPAIPYSASPSCIALRCCARSPSRYSLVACCMVATAFSTACSRPCALSKPGSFSCDWRSPPTPRARKSP